MNNQEPYCNMIEAEDYNCFEFYKAATEQFGNYDQMQHMDARYTRSQIICDIEALATYFVKELHLKRGDAFTIFMPTNVESLVGFYALNKIGVIVNFVHPLLPTEVVLESVREAKSKGLMVLGLLCKDHIDAINKTGLPVILCRVSDYASKIKHAAAGTGEAMLEKIFPKFTNARRYSDIMRMYRGRTTEGV